MLEADFSDADEEGPKREEPVWERLVGGGEEGGFRCDIGERVDAWRERDGGRRRRRRRQGRQRRAEDRRSEGRAIVDVVE